MKNQLVKNAIKNSLGVAIYIVLVSLVMRYGENLFGNNDGLQTIIGVLGLMVVSAAVVGSLIFAKPIMLYIDGQKKESIKLLFYTIIFMAILVAIYLVVLGFVK